MKRAHYVTIALFGFPLIGCVEPPTGSIAPDLKVNNELVKETERRAPDQINAHVYGTFALLFGTEGPSVIMKGPANFPGNPPAGPGTCESGLWINSAGRPTRGDKITPHPHCVAPSSAVTVVLEPISAFYTGFAAEKYDYTQLQFGFDKLGLQITQTIEATKEGELGSVIGSGYVYGYAIDAATLGTTNTRVGTIFIKLEQYSASEKLFDTGCTLGGTSATACLDRLVVADYKPFAIDGVGAGETATGFLWFAPSTSPYNY